MILATHNFSNILTLKQPSYILFCFFYAYRGPFPIISQKFCGKHMGAYGVLVINNKRYITPLFLNNGVM